MATINKGIVMFVGSGILIGGAIIGWLFNGDVAKVNVGDKGVTAKINATLKDTVVSREKNGQKEWEFSVAEVSQDRKANKAYLRGLKGRLYQNNGQYIDITAEGGEATLNKKDNNFSVKGKVTALASDGSKMYADSIEYTEKGQIIKAIGNVRLQKDGYAAWGDEATSTAALETVKLRGNAKVEKGGTIDVK